MKPATTVRLLVQENSPMVFSILICQRCPRGREKAFRNRSSLVSMMVAGTIVMENSQATAIPKDVNKPNTFTGGMSVKAREEKPTAVVRGARKEGRYSSSMTASKVLRLSL